MSIIKAVKRFIGLAKLKLVSSFMISLLMTKVPAILSLRACFCGGAADNIKPIPMVMTLSNFAIFLFKATGKVIGFSYWSVTSISRISLPIDPCQVVLSHMALYKI